jgi:hypothetical protein
LGFIEADADIGRGETICFIPRAEGTCLSMFCGFEPFDLIDEFDSVEGATEKSLRLLLVLFLSELCFLLTGRCRWYKLDTFFVDTERKSSIAVFTGASIIGSSSVAFIVM